MADSAIAIAQAIVSAPSAYDSDKAAALCAARLQKTVEALPTKEGEFII